MKQPRMIRRLDQLPESGSICIYGAGGLGKLTHDFIERRRPRLKVVAYADTFRRGDFEGLPILSPEQLGEREDLDHIAVASMYWREIVRGLPPLEHLFVLEHWINIYFQPLCPDEPLEIEPHHYRELMHTRSLLSTEADRALFDKIIDIRRGYWEPLLEHNAAVGMKPSDTYLDFVDLSRVKLAVDGGLFDGETAALFLKRMSSGSRLIGFEPFRETYYEGAYRKRLERDWPQAFQVEHAALWHENTTLNFHLDAGNASASKGGSRVVSGGGARDVPGVRLDDYFERHRLHGLDFLKLDIEGADELEALEGARGLIQRDRPQMAICIYHYKEHLYQVPRLIAEMVEDYEFHVGHYADEPPESVFYAIPKEIAAANR